MWIELIWSTIPFAILEFAGRDEMGFECKRFLIAELMGKYSNLILTDEENKILAVAKPIDFADSDIRQLLPGLIYAPPPVIRMSEDKRSLSCGFFQNR